MKKFLASILTLALCLGLATGCAGKQTLAENDTESAGETGVKAVSYTHLLEVIVGSGALRDDENSVHLPAQQQLEHGLFLLQIRTGITEHDVITVGPGADFRVVGKLRHELVVHRGDHQSDEVGALGHHGPGHKVGGVAHLIA